MLRRVTPYKNSITVTGSVIMLARVETTTNLVPHIKSPPWAVREANSGAGMGMAAEITNTARKM